MQFDQIGRFWVTLTHRRKQSALTKGSIMNANNTYLDCLETQRQARALRGDLLSIGYAIAALPLAWAAVYIAFI